MLRFALPVVVFAVGCSSGGPGGLSSNCLEAGTCPPDSTAPDGESPGDGGELPIEDSTTDGAVDSARPDVAAETPVCTPSVYGTTRVPASLYLLMDRSGSMNGAKWTGATAALDSWLKKRPDSLEVGIGFHPPTSASTTSCTPTDYVPAVPVGALGITRSEILCTIGKGTSCGSTVARTPSGVSALGLALQEGASYLTRATTSGARAIILVSDGGNTACGPAEDVISRATAAAAGSPKISVHVIGLTGSDASLLSRTAHAGDGKREPNCTADTTDPARVCHHAVAEASAATQFEAALDAIAARAGGCVYRIDSSVPSGELRASVRVTSGAGIATTLPSTSWSLEDGNRLVRIQGEACEALLADSAAQVRFEIGCR
jgi:hypothetical protein